MDGVVGEFAQLGRASLGQEVNLTTHYKRTNNTNTSNSHSNQLPVPATNMHPPQRLRLVLSRLYRNPVGRRSRSRGPRWRPWSRTTTTR